MDYRNLVRLPNLLSLFRVILAPVIWHFLRLDTPGATATAAGLVILAGVTDGLDGYLARKMDCVTRLGIALDPIADKLFALFLVIGLILYRDFPVWLAAAVIVRDLLILAGGLWLTRGRDLSLPSNLTGKWTFAALAVLLGAYVIRFEFSIALMTPIVVALLIASLVSYGRVFMKLRQGQQPQPFNDRPLLRTMRYTLLAAAAVAHIVMFYREFLS